MINENLPCLIFTHSAHKHLLSTYCISCLILGSGNTAANKTDTAPIKLHFKKKQTNKYTNKHVLILGDNKYHGKNQTGQGEREWRCVLLKWWGKAFWERHLSRDIQAMRVQTSRRLKRVSGKRNSK